MMGVAMILRADTAKPEIQEFDGKVPPTAFRRKALAPDIIATILNGRQPVELAIKHLKRLKPLPLSWAEQRQRLGFPPAV